MTSSKYPADIIETVAKAAHRADCGCSDWRVTDDDHSYLDIAVAALDALGLKPQIKDAEFYKGSRRKRYVTEWRNLDD